MNFGSPGWFSRYLAFRTEQPLGNHLPSAGVRVLDHPGVHHEMDQAIYYFLQPTGLLYGYPVGWPYVKLQYPQSQYFDSSAKVHLIFLEALFGCMVADRHFLLEGMAEEADHLGPATRLSTYFFLNAPSDARRGWNWFVPRWRLFQRNGHRRGRFEKIMSRRIGQGTKLLNIPDYYNSFLFLEIFHCLQWQRRLLLEPAKRREALFDLHARQMQLRETLLELQIVAAHASGAVDAAEQRLFDQFLRAAGLPKPRQQQLREAMRRGLTLEQVAIPEMPWLVRRYFLDVIVMVLLIDGTVDELEQKFVVELVERLGLWREELEQCRAALEAFLIHQEQHLHLLHARPQALRLADRLRERATVAIRKNLDRLMNEVRETHELYALLMKATRHPLTAEEKRKVRSQLYDIMKTIPALAIFALPAGGVILPILIRLLPFNLLPSSFDD
jgi:tellurite resistance protein